MVKFIQQNPINIQKLNYYYQWINKRPLKVPGVLCYAYSCGISTSTKLYHLTRLYDLDISIKTAIFSTLSLMLGAVLYFNEFINISYLLIWGYTLTSLTLILWFRDNLDNIMSSFYQKELIKVLALLYSVQTLAFLKGLLNYLLYKLSYSTGYYISFDNLILAFNCYDLFVFTIIFFVSNYFIKNLTLDFAIYYRFIFIFYLTFLIFGLYNFLSPSILDINELIIFADSNSTISTSAGPENSILNPANGHEQWKYKDENGRIYDQGPSTHIPVPTLTLPDTILKKINQIEVNRFDYNQMNFLHWDGVPMDVQYKSMVNQWLTDTRLHFIPTHHPDAPTTWARCYCK